MPQNAENRVPFFSGDGAQGGKKSSKKAPVYTTEIEANFCVNGGERQRGLVRRISMQALFLEASIEIEVEAVLKLEFPLVDGQIDEKTVEIRGKIVAGRPESPLFCYEVLLEEMGEDDVGEEKKSQMVDLIANLLMSGTARSISS